MRYLAVWRWSPGAVSSRPSPQSSPPLCFQWWNERHAPASADQSCELGPEIKNKRGQVPAKSPAPTVKKMSDSVNSLALNKERAVQHFTVPTMAWRSTWGFQSESYRMTTSAVAKLIPSPPALVLNMKMNFELLGSLYALIEICKCTKIHENEIYFAKLILFPEKKKKKKRYNQSS